MATRFYLPTDTVADVLPAYDTGWEKSTNSTRRKPVLVKRGSTHASASGAASAAGANADTCYGMYVTDQLAAQTVAGTIKGMIGASEGASAQDARAQMVVRVVSADGSTFRGTLLAMDVSALSNEWATSLASKEVSQGVGWGGHLAVQCRRACW